MSDPFPRGSSPRGALISVAEIARQGKLAATNYYKDARAGKAPKPVCIHGVHGVPLEEALAWLKERAERLAPRAAKAAERAAASAAAAKELGAALAGETKEEGRE